MNDKPTIPAPAYSMIDAINTCLALAQRALDEVRVLARIPGPRGEAGPEGKPGPIGDKGERGAKGDPGRNATDLELMQDYCREQVERMIKSASVTTNDGGRTLLWSIGETVHQVKTAAVLDAGVWKEGATYVAGDAVSHGGSLFIAQADTTARPGKSDEWRLAVKRGNDGRDYRADDKRSAEPVRFK